ncbi:MAG TPA: ABC transporter permease subunit [Thermoplasmata archaeon]|nr:ABC transporter permease subunit [Thermoplasmata archaeon]
MNPFFRDLERQLSTPSTLIVVGLLILSAVGIVATSATRPSVVERNVAITMMYSGEFEFSVFASDASGRPLAGDRITILLSDNNSSTPVGSAIGITPASGLLTLDIRAPLRGYQFSERSSLGGGLSTNLKAPPPNRVIPIVGIFSVAERGQLGLTNWILVSFPAPEGAFVSGLTIGYFSNDTALGGTGENYTVDLGAYRSIDSLVRFTLPAGVVAGYSLVLYLENASGGIQAKGYFGLGVLNAPVDQEGPAANPFLLWVEEMAVLILMAATVLGYVAYGRDRISGALDPVVALPLGRLQVPALRFASAALSLAIGITVAETALVVGLDRYLGVTLPAFLYGALWIGAFGEGLGMLALVFLLSHVIRSHAAVLAGGLSLAVVFTLLWGTVTFQVARLLGLSATVWGTASWQGSVGLLSPAAAALNPVAWGMEAEAPNGSRLLAQAPNPTLAAVALILWVVLPLVATSLLVRYRD